MGHFLLALVDAKQKLYMEKNEFPMLGAKVTGLLRSFTSRKLKELLKLHQFTKLLLHFINSKEEMMGFVSHSQDGSECTELFESYIASLEQLARKSI